MAKDELKKHVLVTGGAGFIGSHLCEALLQRGYAVTAMDNFLTGARSNVEGFLKRPFFSFIEWDVAKELPLERIPFLNKFGLSGVLHFACPASPVDFDKIPFDILRVDSLGTMHTVDLALKYNARYLLASTSEIYGDPEVHPQTEDYWGNVNCTGPRACYDEAKRFSEAYVSTSMRHKKLNAGIVRIFNTYGPRMRPDDGRVIPEFFMNALKGTPLPVCGDGKQTRSLCFISDLVEGIIRMFESSLQEPVNLGNPDERSIYEMAEIVRKKVGSSSSIQFVPARPEDPRQRRPDITRAMKKLGWKPVVGLDQGLEETLKYFRTKCELENLGALEEQKAI